MRRGSRRLERGLATARRPIRDSGKASPAHGVSPPDRLQVLGRLRSLPAWRAVSRLFGGGRGADDPPPRLDAPEENDGEHFHAIASRLRSESAEVRREAALILSTFRPEVAAKPLVRAFAATGDRHLLETAAAYGHRLTAAVAREALDFSLAPSHRARLMRVLGAGGDPTAIRILREAAREWEPEVRSAALAGLVQLDDEDGRSGIARELLAADAARRVLAMRALSAIDCEAARQLETEHALRYLAHGASVPREIGVTMPLLIDADADLASLLATMAERSDAGFTLVTGPATGTLADMHRDRLFDPLTDRRVFFSTDRHSAEEQLDILDEACHAAVEDSMHGGPARPGVVMFGPVPRPDEVLPSSGPGPLASALGYRLQIQVVLAGPHKLDEVMIWWVHLGDGRDLWTALHVVVVDLRLDGEGGLSDEELAIQAVAHDRALRGNDGQAFARAFLAHRRGLG